MESGEIWTSGGRTVRVVRREDARVVVRDTYGWRRSLTEDELEQGFVEAADHHARVRGVMARRALADIEPA
jgi:hypothetical protein